MRWLWLEMPEWTLNSEPHQDEKRLKFLGGGTSGTSGVHTVFKPPTFTPHEHRDLRDSHCLKSFNVGLSIPIAMEVRLRR